MEDVQPRSVDPGCSGLAAAQGGEKHSLSNDNHNVRAAPRSWQTAQRGSGRSKARRRKKRREWERQCKQDPKQADKNYEVTTWNLGGVPAEKLCDVIKLFEAIGLDRVGILAMHEVVRQHCRRREALREFGERLAAAKQRRACHRDLHLVQRSGRRAYTHHGLRLNAASVVGGWRLRDAQPGN